jgi:hypothetical protein
MSRSNPNENTNPNPAVRWFEWNGEQGVVRYYDKESKKNIDVGSDFTFLLLDQVGRVGGWHDASDSGIYSNEVKDTRQETLIVKALKGGTLAEGLYRDIKDRVKSEGGQYVANCYIAFKNGGNGLAIGSLRFKGAALHAWADFTKDHRSDLYAKAIRINGFTEGKKGKVVFRVPFMETKDVSPETNDAAVELDRKLQEFFDGYFKRTKREQVEEPDHVEGGDYDDDDDRPYDDTPGAQELTDDDIPF